MSSPHRSNVEIQATERRIKELLHELPGYWVSSEDIRSCVGGSIQSVSSIAADLAKRGVIESRLVIWRSAKSRPRRRFEFRYPGEVSTWLRYPPWLEPELFSVSANARLVRGRCSIADV